MMKSLMTARARRRSDVGWCSKTGWALQAGCLLLATVAVVGIAFAPEARGAVEFRLTHPADLNHPVHVAAVRMVKRIEERTKGEVKIAIFPNNALGAPPEAAQQVRLGVIDRMLLNPANVESVAPTLGVINIPYQFDGYAHAHRTLDSTAAEWLQGGFRKAGFELIGYYEWGFRALSNSVRPVNSPGDVKGLKIRVPPELAIKAAFESLGAVTATIAYPEVYMALATKTVDGQDNPIANTWAAKFFQVKKHIALTKHIYATICFAASPKAWARLTPEQQAIVTQEGRRAGNEVRKEVQDQQRAYLADAAGLGVVEIDAMTKAGYSARFSAAITAVSSTIGPIIPPSIPFVIYGSLTNVSVGALFLGGIIPGLLMGFALMAVIALVARRQGLPRMTERPAGREALRMLAGALPALAMPVIIVGGILSGWFTPTEAAVVASIYAMFLEMWPYILALIVVLGVVTYVPDLVMWLPRTFGFAGA